jgi:putative transposase
MVPWTGLDLINAFNVWKTTADAGRVFSVDAHAHAEVVTGVAWRTHVCQQVFEKAAVDLGTSLRAWSDSRCGRQRGQSAWATTTVLGHPARYRADRGS